MPAIQDITSLRDAVRAKILNVGPGLVGDTTLDQHIISGLNRLNKDEPMVMGSLLPVPDGNIYDINDVIEWQDGFSRIQSVQFEYDEILYFISDGDYRTWRDPENDHLLLSFGYVPRVPVSFRYSSPWMVAQLDGAAQTTLTVKYDNAIVFISAAFLCYALASQAAGNSTSAIRGDLVAYNRQTSNYRAMGMTYEMQYEVELGQHASKVPAASAGLYRELPTLTTGHSYITHTGGVR